MGLNKVGGIPDDPIWSKNLFPIILVKEDHFWKLRGKRCLEGKLYGSAEEIMQVRLSYPVYLLSFSHWNFFSFPPRKLRASGGSDPFPFPSRQTWTQRIKNILRERGLEGKTTSTYYGTTIIRKTWGKGKKSRIFKISCPEARMMYLEQTKRLTLIEALEDLKEANCGRKNKNYRLT